MKVANTSKDQILKLSECQIKHNTTKRYGGVDIRLHSFLTSVLAVSGQFRVQSSSLHDKFSVCVAQEAAWDADPAWGVWNTAMCCYMPGIERRFVDTKVQLLHRLCCHQKAGDYGGTTRAQKIKFNLPKRLRYIPIWRYSFIRY
jgi:hypothetical protein